MLPTPDTSHVPYERVYEPAEDSFLFLDTLSSESEKAWLRQRFNGYTPVVVELGTGSGVVIGFVTAHAGTIFGKDGVFTAGVDMNAFACRATRDTVQKAQLESKTSGEGGGPGTYLCSSMGDLAAAWRPGAIDVLIFNPPYVPTSEMPLRPSTYVDEAPPTKPTFDDDSYLLSLSYAGGADGMETTERLMASLAETVSTRGCAYILFCAQNKPDEVKRRIQNWGAEWRAETVGSSGKTAGREKLQVVRIWREYT